MSVPFVPLFPPKDVFFAFAKVFKQGSLLCLSLLAEVPLKYIGINPKKKSAWKSNGGLTLFVITSWDHPLLIARPTAVVS